MCCKYSEEITRPQADFMKRVNLSSFVAGYERGHVSISAALLGAGFGSIKKWPLGATVPVSTAGATVAVAAIVFILPNVANLDALCAQWVSGTLGR
jgi:hypothetical protein